MKIINLEWRFLIDASELRATELENAVTNSFYVGIPEERKQEIFSIWDCVHSYIQHLLLGNDQLEYHQVLLNSITEQNIDLVKYRELALAKMPAFSLIEQKYKVFFERENWMVSFSWTADAIWVDWNLYDIKCSAKKRPPSKVKSSKQKIYYTAMRALLTWDYEPRTFSYCIFTKEANHRLFVETELMNPVECIEILKEDVLLWLQLNGKREIQHVSLNWFI